MALLTTETEAERGPAEVGVKVTEIVQLAPTATVVPQLLVSLKSAALVPVTAMPLIESAAVPVLDNVSIWQIAMRVTHSSWNHQQGFSQREGERRQPFVRCRQFQLHRHHHRYPKRRQHYCGVQQFSQCRQRSGNVPDYPDAQRREHEQAEQLQRDRHQRHFERDPSDANHYA